jgi:hypothetical protein
MVEYLISGSLYGINGNLTTTALLNNPSQPIIYSNLSLGFKLPWRILLIPQAQFEFTKTRLGSTKLDIEKKFMKSGTIKVSWEHNYLVNIRNVQFSIRYDFPYAQTSFNSMVGDISTNFTETARGSLMYDHHSKWVGTGNLVSVGKGGIVVVSFLDLNYNGKRDFGEPKTGGLNVKVTGGRIEECERDSCLRIFDLEPYATYFLEIDPNSYDNVSWQIRNPVISVIADPNSFKLVEVPVVVESEISGMVFKQTGHTLEGQGGIWIRVFRNDTIPVHRLLTETDGYFNYMGLTPGNYTVRPDKNQLEKLNLESKPDSIRFTIGSMLEGDYIGGIEFILSPSFQDSLIALPPLPEEEIISSSEQRKVAPDEPVKKNVTPLDDSSVAMNKTPSGIIQDHVVKQAKTVETLLTVQIGAYKNQFNAIRALERIDQLTTLHPVVESENGYFKVRVKGFKSEMEARAFIRLVASNGMEGCFIVWPE